MAILKQLRRRWVGRLLWIDAICIDQTEEAEQERNQQLQIMGHIYSQAVKVIIWLGPSTPESRLALRYLRFLEDVMILPRFVQDWVRDRLVNKIIGIEKIKSSRYHYQEGMVIATANSRILCRFTRLSQDCAFKV
jgi:hypothetical protein